MKTTNRFSGGIFGRPDRHVLTVSFEGADVIVYAAEAIVVAALLSLTWHCVELARWLL